MKFITIILDWGGVVLSASALYSVFNAAREARRARVEREKKDRADVGLSRERLELILISDEIQKGIHAWIIIKESPGKE